MMHLLGGHVCKAPVREYGKTEVFVDPASKLFADISSSTVCWMSHTDYIESVAPGFVISAHSANCPAAAMEQPEKRLYALQFHPEVLHTQEGTKMLSNFIYNVCGCTGDWKMDSFVEQSIRMLREKSETGACCVHFRAAWILLLRPSCWQKLWASSLPVCSWITAS